MWSRTYSKTVRKLEASRVWKVWSDVNRWHFWQDDIDYARLEGEFVTGGRLRFKPRGGPELTLELTEVRAPSTFTDVTRFPLARMIDSHELVASADGLEIRTTIRMEGALAFLWRKMVGEDVARSLPQQTEKLIAEACRE
jgi:hypothetical protein